MSAVQYQCPCSAIVELHRGHVLICPSCNLRTSMRWLPDPKDMPPTDRRMA